jgi:hypothetical protein
MLVSYLTVVSNSFVLVSIRYCPASARIEKDRRHRTLAIT